MSIISRILDKQKRDEEEAERKRREQLIAWRQEQLDARMRPRPEADRPAQEISPARDTAPRPEADRPTTLQPDPPRQTAPRPEADRPAQRPPTEPLLSYIPPKVELPDPGLSVTDSVREQAPQQPSIPASRPFSRPTVESDIHMPRPQYGPQPQPEEPQQFGAFGGFGGQVVSPIIASAVGGRILTEIAPAFAPVEPEEEEEPARVGTGDLWDALAAWREGTEQRQLAPFLRPEEEEEPTLLQRIGQAVDPYFDPDSTVNAIDTFIRGTAPVLGGALLAHTRPQGAQDLGERFAYLKDTPSFQYAKGQADEIRQKRAGLYANVDTPWEEAQKIVKANPGSVSALFHAGLRFFNELVRQGPYQTAQDIVFDQTMNLWELWDGTLHYIHTTPPDEMFAQYIGTYDGEMGQLSSMLDILAPVGMGINQALGPHNLRTSETFWTDSADPDGGIFGTGVQFSTWENLKQGLPKAFSIATREYEARRGIYEQIAELQEEYPDAPWMRLLAYSDSEKMQAGINEFIAKQEGFQEHLERAFELEAAGEHLAATIAYATAYDMKNKSLTQIVDDNQSLPGYIMAMAFLDIPGIGLGRAMRPLSKVERSAAATRKMMDVSPEKAETAWATAWRESSAILDEIYTGTVAPGQIDNFVKKYNPLRKTPETLAQYDARSLHELMVGVLSGVENGNQARHLIDLLTSEAAPELFKKGVGILQNANVSQVALTRFGPGLLANENVLSRMPVLRMAREKLLGMRSLGTKQFVPGEVAQEMAGVLMQAGRQFRGASTFLDLPFGAKSIDTYMVSGGRYVTRFLDDAGRVIRTGLPDTKKAVDAQAANLRKLMDEKNFAKSPIRSVLDWQAEIQREIISTNYFALNPINHTIMNAGAAYTGTFTERGWSWLNRESITRFWGNKMGDFAPTLKMGEITGQITGDFGLNIRNVVGGTSLRSGIKKIPVLEQTLGKLIDLGFSIPYGGREARVPLSNYSVAIGEEMFRMKNFHAAGERYFRNNWNRVVDSLSEGMNGLGFESDVVQRYANHMKEIGLMGSRKDVASYVRKAVEKDVLPYVASDLRIPDELISLESRGAIDDLLATLTPDNVNQVSASIRSLLKSEANRYGVIARMSPPSPIQNWTSVDNTREAAKLYDSLLESATRAGLSPEDAAVRARTIAQEFESAYANAFKSLSDDLFAADFHPQLGDIMVDFFAQMMDLKTAARTRADELAREAIEAGNTTGWQRHIEGTENVWKEYGRNMEQLSSQVRSGFARIQQGGTYEPLVDSWENVARRYMEFDPNEFEFLRQFDASLVDPEMYERIIRSNRSRIDASFAQVVEAMREYPTRDGFDMVSNLWRWSDRDGAITKSHVLALNEKLGAKAINIDTYRREVNSLWRQHFDNVVDYATAARQQIVGMGITEQTVRDLVYREGDRAYALIGRAQREGMWRLLRLDDGTEVIRGNIPRRLEQQFDLTMDGMVRAFPEADSSVVRNTNQILDSQVIGQDGANLIQDLARAAGMVVETPSGAIEHHIRNAIKKDLDLDVRSLQQIPARRFDDVVDVIRRRATAEGVEIPDVMMPGARPRIQHFESSLAKQMGLEKNATHEEVVQALREYFTNSRKAGGNSGIEYGDIGASGVEEINKIMQRVNQELPRMAKGQPNRLTPAQKQQLVKLADEQLLPAFDDILSGARHYGQDMADFVMLNYNNRTMLDQFLNVSSGYWYFLSRMPSRYIDMAMRYPQIAHTWHTHNKVMEMERRREELPDRFRETYPDVLAERFGGAERGQTRRRNLINTFLPFNVYMSPSPFAGINEAQGEAERTFRQWNTGGFFLPAINYAADYVFDITSPLPDGRKRTDQYNAGQYSPLIQMANYYKVSKGGEPIGGYEGFLRAGRPNDPFIAARAGAIVGIEEEVDPLVIQYMYAYIDNLYNGREPLADIPPAMAAEVTELAERALAQGGEETFNRLTTNYVSRMPQTEYTAQEREMSQAGQQWHRAGYDPYRMPVGSRAAQSEQMEENPYLSAWWGRVALIPGARDESPLIQARRADYYVRQSTIYDNMNEAMVAAVLDNPDMLWSDMTEIRKPFQEELDTLREDFSDVPQLEGTTRGMNPREKTQREIETMLRWRPGPFPERPADPDDTEAMREYYRESAVWNQQRLQHIHNNLVRMSELEEPYSDQHIIAGQMLEGLYASDLIRQFGNRFLPQPVYDWAERRAFASEVSAVEWQEREGDVERLLGEEGLAAFREYMDADSETRQLLKDDSNLYQMSIYAAFNTEQFEDAVSTFGEDWYDTYRNAPRHPGDEATDAQLKAYWAELNAYKLQHPDYEGVRLWLNGRPIPQELNQKFVEEYGYYPRDFGKDYAEADRLFDMALVAQYAYEEQKFIEEAIAANPQNEKAGGAAYYTWHAQNPAKSQVLGAYDGWRNEIAKGHVEFTYEDLVASQPVGENDKTPGLETYDGPRPYGTDMPPIVEPGTAATGGRTGTLSYDPRDTQQAPRTGSRPTLPAAQEPATDGEIDPYVAASIAMRDPRETQQVPRILNLEEAETVGMVRGTDPIEVAATQEGELRDAEYYLGISDAHLTRQQQQAISNHWDRYRALGDNWAAKRQYMLDNPDFANHYTSLTGDDGTPYAAWWLNWVDYGSGGRGGGGAGAGQWSAHWDAYRPLSTPEKAEYLRNNPDFAAHYLAEYADEDWWTDYADWSEHWDAYRPLTTAEKRQYFLDNPDFAEYYNERYPESANWWLSGTGGSSGFTPWSSSWGGGGGGRREGNLPRPSPTSIQPGRFRPPAGLRQAGSGFWRAPNVSSAWMQAGAALRPRS